MVSRAHPVGSTFGVGPYAATLRVDDPTRRIALLIAVHVLFGLAAKQSEALALAHCVLTICVGLWMAATGARLERIAYVGAYIVGAEVLWRMTGGAILWEIGKFSIALIFLTAMIRQGKLRIQPFPFLYFVLLLPSAVLTVLEIDAESARGALTFNMSGPLALMAASLFFSQFKITRAQLQNLFVYLIAPVAAVAAITLFGIVTDPYIVYGFRNGSNFSTSGGFGPNQVSAVLGLGAMFGFFALLNLQLTRRGRILFAAVSMFLIAQCLLTFSRGGVYNVVLGIGAAAPFLLAVPHLRRTFLITLAVSVVLGAFVILPGLNSFTEGTLSTRLESTGTTGRDEIMQGDIDLWIDNPIFGVGPGQAEYFRSVDLGMVAAHTEFTRLVAEHGLFGAAALGCLLLAGLQCLHQAPTMSSKAMVSALMVWSLFEMGHGAMRIAAPSFLFGLAYAIDWRDSE
jgi:O-antigen ligase